MHTNGVPPHISRGPLIVAAMYAIVGTLWILFSDRIMAEFVSDPERFATISTWKGWAYVLFTAFLLYHLMRNLLSRQSRYAEQCALEKRLLGTTLEALPVGVVIVDADGTITDGNKAFEEIWGELRRLEKADYGEYKGWWPTSGRQLEAHEWGIYRALVRGETSRDEVIDIETFTGQRKTILTSSVPLLDTRGTIAGAIAVNQDITALVKAQAEVRTLNLDLEKRVRERTAQQEQAVQELEALSFAISHDLRAPLHHIVGYSRALQEECSGRLDEKAARCLERIIAATEKMEQMINALRALSRISRGEIQRRTICLSEMVRELLGQFREQEPDRSVQVAITDGIMVEAEIRLLHTVMEELLGNAWKFSSGKSLSFIEFGEMPIEGERVFYVRDNGAGFPMEYASKLFVPFQRLHSDKEFPGIGMGIATAQRIINRHGGRIWAEGSPGRGATFYFTLSPDTPPA